MPSSENLPRHRDFNSYLTDVRQLCLGLYPDDSTEQGKILRLKQQYFFVSAGLQAQIKAHLRTYKTLNNLAEKYNFKLYVLPPYKCGETVVSSTKIREAISNGKVEKAKKMLNRAYSLKGKVVYGDTTGIFLSYQG